jgi:hypothetical protein
MKTEYNIKDKVWIHIGERTLTEGRVVEIITLDHLNENHRPGHELYVIEIKTGIDDIYEVRDFDEISPDDKGPITFFRNRQADALVANRFLKKVGVKLPTGETNLALYDEEFEGDGHDGMGSIDDPTPEQIHAAIERAERAKNDQFRIPVPKKTANKRPSKKRTFTKRPKKNDNTSSNT